ncbi:MAG: response regulator [Bdellovibrionales bacterium]|nr:response regulator [Bdellovibrionales bacterium]
MSQPILLAVQNPHLSALCEQYLIAQGLEVRRYTWTGDVVQAMRASTSENTGRCGGIVVSLDFDELDLMDLLEKITGDSALYSAKVFLAAPDANRADAEMMKGLGVDEVLLYSMLGFDPTNLPPLPEDATGAVDTSLPPEAPADSYPEVDPEKPLVLVIEAPDNSLVQVIHFLRLYGYPFEVVKDAAKGVARFAELPFQVALLDAERRDVDGGDILSQLRAAPQGAGSVLVAAGPRRDDALREKCMSAGANAFLEKPIRALELRRVLRSSVKLSST